MQGFLAALARFVTGRRHAVIVATLLLTAALGAQLPWLQNDPSVNAIVTDFEDQQAVAARFRETFGDHENVTLVLVEASDVLAAETLEHLHTLAVELRKSPRVAQVDGLTTTPLPHRKRATDGGAGGALLGMLGEAFAPVTRMAPETRRGADGALERHLASVVDADPTAYPGGVAAVAGRLLASGLSVGPLVEGADVDAAEVAAVRRTVAETPLLRGRLISDDGRLTVLAVTLDGSIAHHDDLAEAVAGIRAVLARHEPPPGVTRRLGGLPPLRTTIVEKMQTDQMVIMPLVVLVCVVLLVLAFRWWPGVVFPLVAVGVTIVQVLGIMPLAGLSMNIITSILPPLLIIIGISDAIHLVGRYREEIARGRSREAAARQTVSSMALACLLTSVTTAVGFASLAVARTRMLEEFGIISAVGVLLAYVVTVGLVPALLLLVPAPASDATVRRAGRLERALAGITVSLVRRPWRVLAAAAVFIAVVVGVGRHVSIDIKLLDQFDAEEEVAVTTRLLEDKLGGVRPLEVALQAPGEQLLEPAVIDALDDVLAWARQQPGVLGASAYQDELRQTRALLQGTARGWERPFKARTEVAALAAMGRQSAGAPRGLTADHHRARLTVRLADVGARRSITIIDAFDARLRSALAAHPGVSYRLTGEAYTGSKGLDAVVHDLLGGLLLAVAVIFVILAALFRSLRFGLLALPPNLLPALGTLGYMTARGIPLTTGTAIIFAISIGLAVDGTIHVMARYREEQAHGLARNVAIVRAARGTGRAIVVTCATLSLGFSVLLASSFVTVRQFGELIAVTVVGCLLATIFVQPALLAVGVPSPLKRRRAGADQVSSSAP